MGLFSVGCIAVAGIDSTEHHTSNTLFIRYSTDIYYEDIGDWRSLRHKIKMSATCVYCVFLLLYAHRYLHQYLWEFNMETYSAGATAISA